MSLVDRVMTDNIGTNCPRCNSSWIASSPYRTETYFYKKRCLCCDNRFDSEPIKKQGIERVEQIFDERKELFKKKNKNYGSSYIKTGEIIDLVLEGNPPILKNTVDIIVIGMIHRILDKIVRYITLRFTEQEDEVAENIAETMGDVGVYSFMLQELEEEKNHDENG